jgi:ubiquinol-cytochrome c reductase cytochrome b subunit
LSLSPAAAETFIMLVFPVLLIAALFLVPFVSNRGERAPSRRPVAALGVVVIYTVLGALTYQGVTAPWSPQMTGWSGDPVPQNIVERSSPRELMGEVVFQNKNCRNCHALEGSGGRRGPDLTFVGSRLTRDQLIDQISNGTPGGGNMPAYAQQMKPAEMSVVVDFLVNARPTGRAPAREENDQVADKTSKPSQP